MKLNAFNYGMPSLWLPPKTLLIMKLTIFILVIALTQVCASGFAQKISLNEKNVPVTKILKSIEDQSGFTFFYDNKDLPSATLISVNIVNASVEEAVKQSLKDLPLAYKIVKDNIVLTRIEPSVLKKTSSILTLIEVHGRVTDLQGEPLPGATLVIKGTAKGAITDNNGNFTITRVDDKAQLVISSMGYKTKTLAVSQEMGAIRLELTTAALDQVQVIGYGTTTKRNNTGSVSSFTSKDIANQPVSDPLAALQGRVAGLEINSTNGYSGSNYSVRLRGINSITGGNNPLYIVDGIPFVSESLNQFTGANGVSSPLNSINPSDIDRIDVLKDADATAIYGSRGANGVILITTKKGKTGKTAMNASVYSGIAYVNHKVDMLNTAQYLALRKEAFKNDNITPTTDNALDLTVWDQNTDNDWQKKLIGSKARLTEAQLSLSGGSELTSFLASGTYRKETTVIPGDQGYQRGAVNLNMNHKSANNKFTLTTTVKYVTDQNNSMPTDVTQYYNTSPNYPVYNADGSYYWPTTGGQNPIAYLERKYESTTQNLSGNAVAKYIILPGLNAQLSAGYNRLTMKQTNTQPQNSFNPTLYTASLAYYGNNAVETYILEPTVDYTHKISKGTLQLLAGATQQSSTQEGQNILGSGFASDQQLNTPSAAVSLTSLSYNYSKYKYSSIYGRATYNWDERYILNGTFRRDGSSRFGPNNKFGNFGAIGAAWLFSNESFIKDKVRFLSFGKLRGSYGTVGNDQIGNYQYYDSWSATDFAYAGSGGLYPSRFANGDYSWEVNRKLEAGIDLGFFNDRILITADVYRNRSSNQLIGYVLSSQSGFTSYTANLPAELENRGLEIELTTVNINNKILKWNTSFNISFSRNKLLAYPGLATSSYSNTYFIGQPINVVTGYQSTGINPANGLATFVDKNSNGTITSPADLFILGTTTPKYYGGMQNTLTYKQLSLNFFFQFVKQEGPLLNYGTLSSTYGARINKDLSGLDRWSTPGQVTNTPIATTTTTAAYTTYNQWRLSSANWGDASFIRLKNVAIRYNLASVFKNIKLNNLSVFVQGQNLFTITPYKGFDPETKGLVLPPLSVYTAGLQVSF